jgi:hypothetical protein
MNKNILSSCEKLLTAYKAGKLGDQTMPEDAHPVFASDEDRLNFYTLPMSLNYQRNSYTLWESATQMHNDQLARKVFTPAFCAALSEDDLRVLLSRYKVALQPNKHTHTWHSICTTIADNWGSIGELIGACDYDYLQLRAVVQGSHKKGFPYLSGPKIFNYWCYILGEYCGIYLENRDCIEIAPDTHVIQCSVRLGVISEAESRTLTREAISERWRKVLDGSGIAPVDMHSPLWFWSRNGFLVEV